eukprot:10946749-Prorocentrum_lima.AAC.1
MAFPSGRKMLPCYACGEKMPFFKMIESWRLDYPLDDPMTLMEEAGKEPMTAKRGRRICPMCE